MAEHEKNVTAPSISMNHEVQKMMMTGRWGNRTEMRGGVWSVNKRQILVLLCLVESFDGEMTCGRDVDPTIHLIG